MAQKATRKQLQQIRSGKAKVTPVVHPKSPAGVAMTNKNLENQKQDIVRSFILQPNSPQVKEVDNYISEHKNEYSSFLAKNSEKKYEADNVVAKADFYVTEHATQNADKKSTKVSASKPVVGENPSKIVDETNATKTTRTSRAPKQYKGPVEVNKESIQKALDAAKTNDLVEEEPGSDIVADSEVETTSETPVEVNTKKPRPKSMCWLIRPENYRSKKFDEQPKDLLSSTLENQKQVNFLNAYAREYCLAYHNFLKEHKLPDNNQSKAWYFYADQYFFNGESRYNAHNRAEAVMERAITDGTRDNLEVPEVPTEKMRYPVRNAAKKIGHGAQKVYTASKRFYDQELRKGVKPLKDSAYVLGAVAVLLSIVNPGFALIGTIFLGYALMNSIGIIDLIHESWQGIKSGFKKARKFAKEAATTKAIKRAYSKSKEHLKEWRNSHLYKNTVKDIEKTCRKEQNSRINNLEKAEKKATKAIKNAQDHKLQALKSQEKSLLKKIDTLEKNPNRSAQDNENLQKYKNQLSQVRTSTKNMSGSTKDFIDAIKGGKTDLKDYEKKYVLYYAGKMSEAKEEKDRFMASIRAGTDEFSVQKIADHKLLESKFDNLFSSLEKQELENYKLEVEEKQQSKVKDSEEEKTEEEEKKKNKKAGRSRGGLGRFFGRGR